MPDPVTHQDSDIEMKRRAWTLAHKLIALSRVVPRQESVHLLDVSTQALCNAMGKPEGAQLEEVQGFAREVVDFMSGSGVYVSCGCGYLSLRVTDERTARAFLEEIIEPVSFKPEDLEAYFVDHILLGRTGVSSLPETCVTDEIRTTMREV